MSIPPKYGRVYTRINGRVSCKAITFSFLRFRCAHGGKGTQVCGYEREKGKGDKQREKEKERERVIEEGGGGGKQRGSEWSERSGRTGVEYYTYVYE